jgi:predicted RNase H-like HicB family nuclease
MDCVERAIVNTLDQSRVGRGIEMAICDRSILDACALCGEGSVLMETRRETVYERGVKSGIYTQERKIEIVVFHSSEDASWGAMLPAMPGLSAFGDTPEQALSELAVVIQAAVESGMRVEVLTSQAWTVTF